MPPELQAILATSGIQFQDMKNVSTSGNGLGINIALPCPEALEKVYDDLSSHLVSVGFNVSAGSVVFDKGYINLYDENLPAAEVDSMKGKLEAFFQRQEIPTRQTVEAMPEASLEECGIPIAQGQKPTGVETGIA